MVYEVSLTMLSGSLTQVNRPDSGEAKCRVDRGPYQHLRVKPVRITYASNTSYMFCTCLQNGQGASSKGKRLNTQC